MEGRSLSVGWRWDETAIVRLLPRDAAVYKKGWGGWVGRVRKPCRFPTTFDTRSVFRFENGPKVQKLALARTLSLLSLLSGSVSRWLCRSFSIFQSARWVRWLSVERVQLPMQVG